MQNKTILKNELNYRKATIIPFPCCGTCKYLSEGKYCQKIITKAGGRESAGMRVQTQMLCDAFEWKISGDYLG